MTNQFNFKFSYSSVKSYMECHRKFYYSYVVRGDIPVPVRDEYYSFIGTAIQAIMENVINARLYKLYDSDELIELINHELDKIIDEIPYHMYDEPTDKNTKYVFFNGMKNQIPINFNKYTKDDLLREISIYIPCLLSLLNGEIVSDLDNVVCEEKIKETLTTESGVKFEFVGYIDFLVKTKNNTYIIIDGKRKVSSYVSKNQLLLYKEMLKLQNKQVSSVYFWDYTKNKLILQDDSDSSRVMSDFQKIVDEVHNRLNLPQSGWSKNESYNSCLFCPFKSVCEKEDKVTEIEL